MNPITCFHLLRRFRFYDRLIASRFMVHRQNQVGDYRTKYRQKNQWHINDKQKAQQSYNLVPSEPCPHESQNVLVRTALECWSHLSSSYDGRSPTCRYQSSHHQVKLHTRMNFGNLNHVIQVIHCERDNRNCNKGVDGEAPPHTSDRIQNIER